MDKKELQKLIWASYLIVVITIVIGLTVRESLMVMLVISVILLLSSFFLTRSWKQKSDETPA